MKKDCTLCEVNFIFDYFFPFNNHGMYCSVKTMVTLKHSLLLYLRHNTGKKKKNKTLKQYSQVALEGS